MELDIDYCNENKFPRYFNIEIVSKVPPVLLNAGFNKSLLREGFKKKKAENIMNLALKEGGCLT